MLISQNDLILAIAITEAAFKAIKHPLEHAAIRDGFLWTTDGHRVMKCPLLEVPDESMGQTLLIHHKDLKTILKRKAKRVQGRKFNELSATDFTIDETIYYPNCDRFLADQSGFQPAGGTEFRESFFGLLHGPGLKVIEFAPHPQGLYGAFHENKQSTYPIHLAGTQDLVKTLVSSIAFRVEYLEDLAAFPFDSAKFVEGKALGKLHLRHADGHEVLIMATELGVEYRHPRFEWPSSDVLNC